jgi:Cu-processing system ATP-binding protein
MIQLADVSKYYGEIKAVDSVSLELREGEVLGLVGPNGSGKSTLLRIILGIAKPTSGKVLLNGEELSEKRWKDFKRSVGYMPERISFYDNLTGRETLQLFSRIKGCRLSETHDIVQRVLSNEALHRRVGGYSKGMRQRLNLSQALLNDPGFLILDEPTSGLDPLGAKEFYTMLDEIKSRKKLTVILSSHMLAEIEDEIDRVAVIKNGLLKAVGSLDELYMGLKLPLKISIAIKGRDTDVAELLKREGATDVIYKDGYLIASVPRDNKMKVLSAILEKQDYFTDFSFREPNLEEVFFGFH